MKASAVSRGVSTDDLAGLLTEITLINTACVAGRGRSLQNWGGRSTNGKVRCVGRVRSTGNVIQDHVLVGKASFCPDVWPLMVSTVLVLVSSLFRIIHIHRISDSCADEPQQMSCFNVFIYSVQATSAAVLGLLNFRSVLLKFCNAWHWLMHQTASILNFPPLFCTFPCVLISTQHSVFIGHAQNESDSVVQEKCAISSSQMVPALNSSIWFYFLFFLIMFFFPVNSSGH